MRTVLEHILMQSDEITIDYLEDNQDILFKVIPELNDEDGFPQKSPWHIYDVWRHTEVAVSNSNYDLEERIALLLHDIGKPHCYQDDGDVRHFKGHAQKSAEMAVRILERLGYTENQVDSICWLIAQHSTPIDVGKVNKGNLEKYKKLLHVQYCDCKAYNPEKTGVVIAKLDSIKGKMAEIEKSNREK